jgi:hypothetical protein
MWVKAEDLILELNTNLYKQNDDILSKKLYKNRMKYICRFQHLLSYIHHVSTHPLLLKTMKNVRARKKHIGGASIGVGSYRDFTN